MMGTYRLTPEQLRQNPDLVDLLSALERGFRKFRIDFYLVGAVARDVWMSGINRIAPRRTTGDIDFAVAIPDKGTYDALQDYLISKEGFQPYRGNSFVLIWKGNREVDLLPFGKIEDEEGTVSLTGPGLTSISLQGFSEVYEAGLPELEMEGSHPFKFCTLPGIVLLKMIAWDDRPEKRRDDIKDISDILNHFFDMNDEAIWSWHSDLFDDDYIDRIHTAARVLGREMRKIGKRNDKLFARIAHILDSNTEDVETSRMALIMAEYFDNTAEDNMSLLRQVRQGFGEDTQV